MNQPTLEQQRDFLNHKVGALCEQLARKVEDVVDRDVHIAMLTNELDTHRQNILDLVKYIPDDVDLGEDLTLFLKRLEEQE